MANNLLPVIVYGPDEEGNHTRVLERFDHDPSRGSYDDLAASAREQGNMVMPDSATIGRRALVAQEGKSDPGHPRRDEGSTLNAPLTYAMRTASDMTFGAAPRVGAAIGSVIAGIPYEDAERRVLDVMEQSEAAHPVAAGLGTATSMVLPMGTAGTVARLARAANMGRVARGAEIVDRAHNIIPASRISSRAGRFAANVANAAPTGAVYGALGGLGETRFGEDDWAEQAYDNAVRGAEQGLWMGPAMSAGLQPVASGAGRVYRAVQRGAQRRANDRRLANALGDSAPAVRDKLMSGQSGVPADQRVAELAATAREAGLGGVQSVNDRLAVAERNVEELGRIIRAIDDEGDRLGAAVPFSRAQDELSSAVNREGTSQADRTAGQAEHLDWLAEARTPEGSTGNPDLDRRLRSMLTPDELEAAGARAAAGVSDEIAHLRGTRAPDAPPPPDNSFTPLPEIRRAPLDIGVAPSQTPLPPEVVSGTVPTGRTAMDAAIRHGLVPEGGGQRGLRLRIPELPSPPQAPPVTGLQPGVGPAPRAVAQGRPVTGLQEGVAPPATPPPGSPVAGMMDLPPRPDMNPEHTTREARRWRDLQANQSASAEGELQARISAERARLADHATSQDLASAGVMDDLSQRMASEQTRLADHSAAQRGASADVLDDLAMRIADRENQITNRAADALPEIARFQQEAADTARGAGRVQAEVDAETIRRSQARASEGQALREKRGQTMGEIARLMLRERGLRKGSVEPPVPQMLRSGPLRARRKMVGDSLHDPKSPHGATPQQLRASAAYAPLRALEAEAHQRAGTMKSFRHLQEGDLRPGIQRRAEGSRQNFASEQEALDQATFDAIKDRFSLAIGAESYLKSARARDAANMGISLRGIAGAAMFGSQGGASGAGIGLLLGSVSKNYGSGISATVHEALSSLLNSPRGAAVAEGIRRHAGLTTANAVIPPAMRLLHSGESASDHFIQSQTDPTYRDGMRTLEDGALDEAVNSALTDSAEYPDFPEDYWRAY